jgi:hypothetical protein
MAVPWLWRLVAGLLTSKARVRSQVSLCEICGGKSYTEQLFLPSNSVLPIILSPMLRTHINLTVVLSRRINGRCLGTLQKSIFLRELVNIG